MFVGQARPGEAVGRSECPGAEVSDEGLVAENPPDGLGPGFGGGFGDEEHIAPVDDRGIRMVRRGGHDGETEGPRGL